MRKDLALITVAAIAAVASAASAATQVSFQYQASPSGTQNVYNIYFTETSSTGMLASELGVSDSGVKITRASGDATILGSGANNIMGTGFDDSSTAAAFTSSSASLNLHCGFTRIDGVEPDASRRVLLGTVTVSPGSASSSFNVTAWGSPNQTISYQSIANLDAAGSIGNTFQWNAAQGSSFIVSAVPEPIALGVMGLSGLLVLRRRRRA